jgi:hypothetical protein
MNLMTAPSHADEKQQESRKPAGKNGMRKNVSSRQDTTAPKPSVKNGSGAESTQEFISSVGGYQPPWPKLIAASLLMVCLVGFSLSHVLFKKPLPLEATYGERTEETTDLSDTAERTPAAEKAHTADERQARQRVSALLEKAKEASASFLQFEAEAAVLEQPKMLAMKTTSSSDRYMERGKYSKAAPGPSRGMSIDIYPYEHSGKQRFGRKSEIHEEVLALFSSVRQAVEDEDIEKLLALFDDSEPDFFRQQRQKARTLFKWFDEIDGRYSDIEIELLKDDQLAVRVYCRVKGNLFLTGRPTVLFDGNQHLTLKKSAASDWKICAIDD